MIPVARIRALIENTTYTAAYDLAEDIAVELPISGVVLSAEEVAQVREAVRPHSCTLRYGCPICRAALALLDGPDDGMFYGDNALGHSVNRPALPDGADEEEK